MNPKLKEKSLEAMSAVLPITGIVLALSIILVPMDLGTFVMFLAGAFMLVIGMGFFQLGSEMAMTPLGEGIGIRLSKSRHASLTLLTGFLMGAIITMAEPDLLVLAEQVPSVPNTVLIFTVAAGVGLFLATAILRILFKIDLSVMLIISYLLLFALSLFVPKDFLAVAFDSGGVTTGPITVPFIMAMGIGLASLRSDKNTSNDSFGLVALSGVGPIIAVMLLGCFFEPTQASYSVAEVANVSTTRDAAAEFLSQLPKYSKEVFSSIIPIAVMFALFQAISRRYHSKQLGRIGVGFCYTFIGLVLFLCGVNVGFAPIGSLLGSGLASSSLKWLLIPIGMLIGYYIVKAEPAIQVLNRQVQSVTNGAVSEKSMNRCMQIGVSVSVGISMLRVLTGIPLYPILIAGYAVALILSRIVPKIFVGIAFDSGGVSSGPMTTTFLLPLSMGACTALGGNIMTDAFGVVALVALTPLIAIQIMGLSYKIKLGKLESAAVGAADYDDDIVEF